MNVPGSVTEEVYFQSAFSGCGKVTEITVDSSNEVYTSRDGIVYKKDMKRLVCCPAGKTGNVSVPENVTYIGTTNQSLFLFIKQHSILGNERRIFAVHLNFFEIAAAKKHVLDKVFENCSRLKNVTCSEGLSSIGERAFKNCVSLAAIELPESVERIDSSAFSGCISLAAIRIPQNVTSISGSNVLTLARRLWSPPQEWLRFLCPPDENNSWQCW